MDSAIIRRMQKEIISPEINSPEIREDALSDEALVGLSQQRDLAAFAELIERHRHAAMKIAFSILRDRNDAEDEVQNAFCKAFQHIGRFQKDAKFSTWLTRIVVNQCLMRLRQMRRARLVYLEEAVTVGEDTLALDLRDRRKLVEAKVGEEQIARVLFDEIRRTPPLLREVFLLRDVQRRPMPEVAAVLGISVAAAKSRLLRARAELRNRMRKHHGSSGPASLMA